ncbi:hypothetical protein C8Q77DRAFT_1157110 [Trametes polyzona]|nr:hypothetical protein C8Q77DRAFT_1157110 [Trametes polyzona]
MGRSTIAALRNVDLRFANSINELLMAMYDVLEAHRTLAHNGRVVRDLSVLNVILYETCGRGGPPGRPSREDVLHSSLRGSVSGRRLRGVIVDLDEPVRTASRDAPQRCTEAGSVDTKAHGERGYEEYSDEGSMYHGHRTGTAMYIARAVAIGEPPGGYASTPYAFKAAKMPMLSVEGKQLYVKAYGEDRYNRYNDVESTCHGGTIPLDRGDEQERPFHHRWEYDAESVFWTMYSVLLRVLPQGPSSQTEETYEDLVEDWKLLNDHRVGNNRRLTDLRESLIQRSHKRFCAPFLPEMRDVATTLHKIAAEVIPSYAVMPSLPPYEDHLHEAMQRLILDYLVAHRDHDIPLQPGILRNTGGRAEVGGSKHSMYEPVLRLYRMGRSHRIRF